MADTSRKSGYGGLMMQIHVGYELIFQCPQATPMILMLNVSYTRAADIVVPDIMQSDPPVTIAPYRDLFGNWCSRIVAPPGRLRLFGDGVVKDSGVPDVVSPNAHQLQLQDLPPECLMFLLPSRYCDTDRLGDIAWSLFACTAPGWSRVQAICDFVHRHITFGYHNARRTRTASEAYYEQAGVCRDFAHLAVAFCRCMNIPARYCTGYLGDIGTEPPYGPMDFAAWFEAYIGGQWHVFDARNNTPRIGRVLIAQGRDAADVAIATTFGPYTLERFTVWTDEVDSGDVESGEVGADATRKSLSA